jgi:hypothetical protein
VKAKQAARRVKTRPTVPPRIRAVSWAHELEVTLSMFARRKLIASVAAAGLALSVATQAPGAPASSQGTHPGSRDKHGHGAYGARQKLQILDRPSHHFHASLLVAQRKAQRHDASAATGGAPFASPESVGVSTGTLDSIASCESGGDPTAVSADGTYRGKYQFDYGTWASVGGSGDPAAAPEAEQDYRAALLYTRSGSSPWPICGS